MSAFCNFETLSLEGLSELMATSDRFRAFGDRLSVVSYTDVVHCRFSSSDAADKSVRDAFFFPYGAVLLWGFTSAQALSSSPPTHTVDAPGTAAAADAAKAAAESETVAAAKQAAKDTMAKGAAAALDGVAAAGEKAKEYKEMLKDEQ